MKHVHFTRRYLLKGATAMYAASTLGSLSFVGCNGGKEVQREKPKQSEMCESKLVATCPNSNPCKVGTDFTIILHGLFFIELWRPQDPVPADQKVRIIAPDCSKLKHIKHVYKAGSWGKPFSDFPEDYYAPKNFNPNNGMPADKNLPEQAQAGSANKSYMYFSLSLPYPKSIRALRVIPETQVSHPGTTAADFPLVTALTYGPDRPPFKILPIPDTSWDPSKNFHIFAEPECIMNCDQMIMHGNETQKAAKDCLPAYGVGPKTQPKCDPPPDPIKFDSCPPCLGAPGVSCEEEKSLWEMAGAKPGPNFTKFKPYAVHMPTCASL